MRGILIEAKADAFRALSDSRPGTWYTVKIRWWFGIIRTKRVLVGYHVDIQSLIGKPVDTE